MTPLELVNLLLGDALWSGIAALGFGLLFNVPPRLLVGCVVCGALGHATRALTMEVFGFNIEPATLAGAIVVGLLAVYFARRLNAPALIFATTGAIPMVPGSFAFRAMLGLIQIASADPSTIMPVLSEAAINVVKTTMILAALALGTAMPTLLFRRRRPVV
jgi:uncharacterized membrane protein YjjB (DUF3815 family)